MGNKIGITVWQEQCFLTVSQNNFWNKIPLNDKFGIFPFKYPVYFCNSSLFFSSSRETSREIIGIIVNFEPNLTALGLSVSAGGSWLNLRLFSEPKLTPNDPGDKTSSSFSFMSFSSDAAWLWSLRSHELWSFLFGCTKLAQSSIKTNGPKAFLF